MSSAILIVEDDPPLRMILEQVLRKRGQDVVSVDSASAALAELGGRSFDLLLTDLMMQPMDGIALMEEAHAQRFDAPVVFITANDDAQMALRAMHLGAFDYVVKPLRIPDLLETVARALTYRERNTVAVLPLPMPAGADVQGIIAASLAMRRVVDAARRLALTNVPILIVGEPGTGKSLFAQLIHDLSHRREGPFRAVDCTEAGAATLASESEELARPHGLLAGGTLCFDRIEGMPLSAQTRLAEYLYGANHRTPGAVRILASSSAPLGQRVLDGVFLAPLYQRLSMLSLVLPPLRERREDRVPIALEMARRVAGRTVVCEADVMAAIESYPWPGNGTEMESVITEAVRQTGAGIMRLSHLPDAWRNIAPDPALLQRSAATLRGRAVAGFLRSRGVPADAMTSPTRGAKMESSPEIRR